MQLTPSWQLLYGDAREVLKSLPSESVQCIITDPPYNIGKNYGRGKEYDNRLDYIDWLWSVWRECSRVAEKGSFLVYTNIIRHLRYAFYPPEPWVFRTVGVWHKPLSLGASYYGIGLHWEPVIIWSKGTPWRPFRSLRVFSNVFIANVVSGTKRNGLREHPTVKPESLLHQLISFAAPPEGVILDPFVGSGTTVLVAKKLGRSAVGIDLNLKYLELARKRLEMVSLPLILPGSLGVQRIEETQLAMKGASNG